MRGKKQALEIPRENCEAILNKHDEIMRRKPIRSIATPAAQLKAVRGLNFECNSEGVTIIRNSKLWSRLLG